jgi:hypothetical protein
MPVLNPPPSKVNPEVVSPVRSVSPMYRGVTVDTRYIPSSALLTHVEGSSMSVNYFSQVVDNDNDLAGQNPTRNPVLQQYRYIKHLELKVTMPLSFQQIEDTRAVGSTGQANIYPFLIPNVGDMFLTDVGDGREGIFQVTNTIRKSIFKDTCYEIEYEFVDFSDTNRLRIMDLNTKVIETFVFVKEFLQYGQNPVLLQEDAEIVKELSFYFHDIMRQWFQEFLSNEYKTLIIPGQAFSTYDHFMTKFMLKMASTLDAPEVQYCRLLNCDGDDNMLTPTILDVCIKRNIHLMRMINRKMGMTAAIYFPHDPMMEGIHHTGIQYVIYPSDPRESWDDVRKMKYPKVIIYSLTEVPSIAGRLEDLITDANLVGFRNSAGPLIKDVLADDYYIFSEAFYNRKPGEMSRLEQEVWNLLERKPVDLKLLKFFCDTYQTWGALERFYYTPFVLMMIRSQIRSL